LLRISFVTLGCKVNQYETEALAELFAENGYAVAGEGEDADIYLVNSCTVTAVGDKKTRQMLRRMKRRCPKALIVLTGCYPQAFPEEAAAIAEADVVTGAKNRHGLLKAVEAALQGKRVVAIESHQKGDPFEPLPVRGLRGRTRAYLKIQDGCERYCSYCIIPKARGRVRSKPLADVAAEAARLAANGYQEVVLVGINLSSYGKDLEGVRLVDAVQICCRIEGIRRVRLGSLEPELLTREDLEQMAAEPKFCPQFHLSLQSGCDRTLKGMNRHYDSAEYRRIAEMIREIFDNPALTTDVMTGFPGESDEDFAASMAFVREMAFAKIHVFAYSPRPGTVAADRPDQIPAAVKDARSAQMGALAHELRQQFLLSQSGRLEEVLVETTETPLGYEGLTRNYTPVIVRCPPSSCGRLIRVRLTAVLDEHCLGELADVSSSFTASVADVLI
jgi:threonylcarbamoyladenosine tRNA methylthiotransferase MtaB